MKNNYIKLANIISNERKKLGISKNKLSDIVGISQTELARIENGMRQHPNLITTIRLCSVLGLNPILVLYQTNFFDINMIKEFCENYDKIILEKDNINDNIIDEIVEIFNQFFIKNTEQKVNEFKNNRDKNNNKSRLICEISIKGE